MPDYTLLKVDPEAVKLLNMPALVVKHWFLITHIATYIKSNIPDFTNNSVQPLTSSKYVNGRWYVECTHETMLSLLSPYGMSNKFTVIRTFNDIKETDKIFLFQMIGGRNYMSLADFAITQLFHINQGC